MNTHRSNRSLFIGLIGAVIALGGFAVAACSDDTTAQPNGGNPFTPTSSSSGADASSSGASSSSGGTSSSTSSGGTSGGPDGGCPTKPANCFCGTPTTQAQFLNRCTNSAALPVNLTVKPATTADIP